MSEEPVIEERVPAAATKQERREQRQTEKEFVRERAEQARRLKTYAKTFMALLIAAGAVYAFVRFASRSAVSPEAVIARGGIHWHPKLTIFIKGEELAIPHNIGIGIRHETIHTHEDLPNLHLEFPGVVTKDDITLGRFFRIWGKRFDRECVVDRCNGPDGTVRFFVNGKSNDEFENYRMHDGDRIEIRYE